MTALWLLIGLIVGYWAKEMYVKLSKITNLFRDRLESPPGVVRPTGQPLTRYESSTQSDTGGVLRPSPNTLALQSMVDQDKRISKGLRDV